MKRFLKFHDVVDIDTAMEPCKDATTLSWLP